MANPFERPYGGQRIKRYARIFGSVASGLRVLTEGKDIRIPIEYMGGLRDQSVPDYSAGVLPVQTLKFYSVVVDSERVRNRNEKRQTLGGVRRQKLPVILGFEWCIRMKKQDELFQLMEQVVNTLYPTLDILVKADDEPSTTIKENLKIVPVSYEFSDSFEGDGTEPNYYDLTFIIELHGGYFYGRNLSADGDAFVIHEVDVLLSTDENTPHKNESDWIHILDNDQTKQRLDTIKPLDPDEGVHHYDETVDQREVIASGNWTRPDYE